MLLESRATHLRDEFRDTPARRAVVAVVRGFGMIQRQMGPYFAQFGLTPPQFQMLTVINRLKQQKVTQRQLSRELYVSFPNVTVMLGRLEREGFIHRSTNPGDGREKLVELTRRGKGLLKQIWKVHQKQLDDVMSGLTKTEQAQLSQLLNKMMAAHEDC